MPDPIIDDSIEVPESVRKAFASIGPPMDAPIALPPAAQHVLSMRQELGALQKENDVLRGLLGNSAKPCAYCGLAAEEQSKCARGFPGCARADDQMLSKHFADGWAAQEYAKDVVALRKEVAQYREALRSIISQPTDVEHEACQEMIMYAKQALDAGDLTLLGLPIVRNIEEARKWFLEHADGSVLGSKEQGSETFRKELRCYSDALLFFNMLA